MNDTVINRLAAHVHDEMWPGWMSYLFRKCTLNSDGTVTIPAWAVERWMRQSKMIYYDLSEQERKSDLDEANRIIEIIGIAQLDESGA